MSKKDIKFIIQLPPVTKKNSQQIIHIGKKCPTCHRGDRTVPLPSKAYKTYEKTAGWFLQGARGLNINTPINLKCLYYMPTQQDVDLANLLEATCDMLVKYNVIEDDKSKIVASHDGSRVLYDKDNPRTEITISFYDSLE